jgi:ParB family chromosome partitioning protein
VVTVSANEVITGYVLLPEEETQASAGEADAVRKLEKQDTRNREIAVENIVDDTRKYIRETELPQSDFTEFEDRLLYFAMLEDLKREHFALFTEDIDKWHLSDEEKITIINNLTEEQKTVIRRDFLIKHLSDAFGVSKKSYLMLEFARLHFPEVLTETEARYNEVYIKRHERIAERLEALNKAQNGQQQEVA